MKRIILAAVIIAMSLSANAQQSAKSIEAAKSAVESAQANADNPKKNTKTATWLKLGQAYMDAYNAPAGNGWIGATEQDLQIVMNGDKVKSTSVVEVGGQQMTKKVYATKAYYFNPEGRLAIIEITKPIYKDALDKALNAYSTASTFDAKGSKTKDIVAAIEGISGKYTDEAYNAYSFGNLEKASKMFEAAAKAKATAPCSKIDTNAVYNSGLTAWMAANGKLAAKDSVAANNLFLRAKKMFEQAVGYGYYGEDGESYAKLADIAEKTGDKEGVKNYLEAGFKAYPSSQSILIGLINYYVSGGENTSRIFELLDLAKKNEPNNASLYYVEGNIHNQLGEKEEAVASYRKCAEINPSYEYGYIGEGLLRYNTAVEIQEKASQEFDDAKYMALVAEFEASLKGCIEPFEKAFELTKDEAVKSSVAEYLKNACFRFRTEDQSYMDKYNKYSEAIQR